MVVLVTAPWRKIDHKISVPMPEHDRETLQPTCVSRLVFVLFTLVMGISSLPVVGRGREREEGREGKERGREGREGREGRGKEGERENGKLY